MILKVVFILLLACAGFAQRFPDRFLSVLPQLSDSTPSKGARFFSAMAGWGAFGRYSFEKDDDHEWFQELGVLVELVRFGGKACLSFQSDIEMIADPHNNIRFNPSEMIWQEGFLYSRRFGAGLLQAGYFHRCRHDLQNLHTGTERTLVFGSAAGGFVLPSAFFEKDLFDCRVDIYTIRQDDRYPPVFEAAKPDVDEITGTFRMKYYAERGPVFAAVLGQANLFGTDDVRFNGGAQAGLFFRSRATFRAGLRYEYFSDTFARALPKSADLVSIFLEVLSTDYLL